MKVVDRHRAHLGHPALRVERQPDLGRRLEVAEVIFGCVVGIGVSWIMSRIWPVLPPRPPAAEAGKEA